MRDFVFVQKDDATKKCTLRTDIVQSGSENFTVMWCEGVQGTNFEKILPWNCGSVLSKTEMEEWFENYKDILDGYIYGGEQVIKLGDGTHELTVVASITGGLSVELTLTATKSGKEPMEATITLQKDTPKVLQGIDGYTYAWTLPVTANWVGEAPAPFVCTEDKEIDLKINIPAN